MMFRFDDPVTSVVIWVYNLGPEVPPLAPALALAVWARRREAKNAAADGGAMPDGASVAAAVLAAGGAEGVRVVEAAGPVADFYDPSRREVRLSAGVFHGRTPCAGGIAAHEAGHALQDAQGSWSVRLRPPLVLGTRLVAGVGWMAVVAGALMYDGGLFRIGVVLDSVAVVALLALLPVERDANRCARAVMDAARTAGGKEPDSALLHAMDAAAWSDVAATLPVPRRARPSRPDAAR